MPKPTRLELVVPVVAMLLMLFATTAYAAWTVVNVRDASGIGNFDNSLDLAEVGGLPAAAYWLDQKLEYTYYDGSQWVNSVVEEDLDFTVYPSLLEIDGKPSVAYNLGKPFSESEDDRLRFAQFDDGNWNSVTVDPVPVGSFSVTLALINGQPAIVYIEDNFANNSESFIKYAIYNGSEWTTQPVTNLSNDSLTLSVELVEVTGQPAIAWRASNGLNYAEFDGMDWNLSAVPTEGTPDPFISLTVVDEQPAIVYSSPSAPTQRSQLYYVQRTANGWLNEMIDERGFSPSLSIIDGQPAIAYAGDNLKYTRLNNDEWETIIIDKSNWGSSAG